MTIEYDSCYMEIVSVRFEGGCDGNLKTISKFLEGMRIKEAISLLEGITCRKKDTSCADQLSKGLQEILEAEFTL